jgi:hypothetical protein
MTKGFMGRSNRRLRTIKNVKENQGYKAIADKLTGKGYKASGGRPFAAYTVERILNNPATFGDPGIRQKTPQRQPRDETNGSA